MVHLPSLVREKLSFLHSKEEEQATSTSDQETVTVDSSITIDELELIWKDEKIEADKLITLESISRTDIQLAAIATLKHCYCTNKGKGKLLSRGSEVLGESFTTGIAEQFLEVIKLLAVGIAGNFTHFLPFLDMDVFKSALTLTTVIVVFSVSHIVTTRK